MAVHRAASTGVGQPERRGRQEAGEHRGPLRVGLLYFALVVLRRVPQVLATSLIALGFIAGVFAVASIGLAKEPAATGGEQVGALAKLNPRFTRLLVILGFFALSKFIRRVLAAALERIARAPPSSPSEQCW